ncbi:MAG: hypothetical protein IIY94_08520 [Oscillospiraceae bacterium]|nr:hypothetical protein [Oscillospiraceae bacterium]
MDFPIRVRLSSRRGASRMTTLFIIMVLIMGGIIAFPYVKDYVKESERFSCQTALDSAKRSMAADYMLTNSVSTETPSAYVINGHDDLCPSGGTVYVREVEPESSNELPYELVCGLHAPDEKLRTRLNSGYVLSQIEQEVARLRLSGTPYPESVTVKLNGEEIIANLVDDYVFFYGGTDATKGVDGTVAYYSIVGHSAFGSDSGVEEGTVWYFCFADENHNATWTPRKGWTGDSYE